MAPPKSQNNGSSVDDAHNSGSVDGANPATANNTSADANTTTSSVPKSSQHQQSSSSTSPKPSSVATSSAANASSSHKQQSASTSSAYSVLPKMSDPTPPLSSVGGLSSSKRSSKDGGNDVNGDGASPYGTRSRNRTGGARPNYAEDKDIDMELFEMYPERREDDPKKASSRNSTSASGVAPSPASSSLEKESLRPTNGNSSERVRKPLPTSSASTSDHHHHSDHGKSNGNSNNHSNHGNHSNHSSKPSSSHANQKENHAPAPVTSTNGTQSQSNPRKRKAASGTSDKSSSGGADKGNLLNISLRKSGAAAAAAAATAALNGVKGYRETNLMTFENSGAKPNKDNQMVADDGSVINVNDHVYLVCEPPGEPYYLGRVMEFLHVKNDTSRPIDALRVNWYYRPRDIGRKAQDTRLVFATMHSDITPLTALRGLCTIKHKAEIDSLDQFRKTPDCFWFEKLYDRYIQKNYEVIPTFQIVNVPERVKKVLDERWRYVLVEQGRGKDLTSAAKQCKRCSGFCASNNSVDCAVCANTYHMNCVRPPLLKKPSRGFAWSCAACSRAQERLLEARHTPNVIDGRTPEAGATVDDDELLDDEDDDLPCGPDTNRTSPEEDEAAHPPATAEQKYQASLWPYRYLGMHCKVEDALDYDDRIYPRAATRVGPRHQAVVQPWPGRRVEYVTPPDIKKSTRREARQNREALAAYEREREQRPKWIQDTPPGYVARGDDWDENDPKCTCFLVYKAPVDPNATEADAEAGNTVAKEKGAEKAAAADAAEPEDLSSKMDIDPPEEPVKAENADELNTEKKDTKVEADKIAKTDKSSQAAKKDKAHTSRHFMTDDEIDAYMAKAVAKNDQLGLPPRSTNLYHVAMTLLFKHGFDGDAALKELDQKKYADFREPQLNTAEQKRFEEAVTKFGSELSLVTRHVKTVPFGQVVRFYYTWKKSDRGKQVWGNSASRKGKKEAKEAKKAEAAAANKIQDDVADDNDDSAFDTGKAVSFKRQFMCKFCNTKTSRQWRRAPAVPPSSVLGEAISGGNGKHAHRDKNQQQNQQQYVGALCRRCSELWRRYSVMWEDVEALTTRVTSAGGRLVKRKFDDELMKEISAADDMMRATETHYNALYQHTTKESSSSQDKQDQPPRKRLKGHGGNAVDKDVEQNTSDSASSNAVHSTSSRRRDRSDKHHDKVTEKASAGDKTTTASGKSGASSGATTAPPVQDIPPQRKLPCAVCYQYSLGTDDQLVACRDCRLTVHRSCYGIPENRNPLKWLCDMCSNDRNPQVSIDYRCVLCPVEHTDHDIEEPSRSTHKKRTEKDRERERVEREQAKKAADYYRKRQEELNKPANPREPLKRTADNNWVHVTCAVWTPEVKFGSAHILEPSEGIPSIPRARYAEVCRVCQEAAGVCVACNQCRALYHVECAHQAGHILGFDIVPVKGSRRDQANVVINGVNHQVTAGIWCKEHVPLKSTVHMVHELVDDTGMSALQFYVESYKQADLALTGCARKANLLTLAAKMSGVSGSIFPSVADLTGISNRRASVNVHSTSNGNAASPGSDSSRQPTPEALRPGGKICYSCATDISPKWYPIDKSQERDMTNGFYGKMGVEAQKFVAQRHFQCHKCKKTGRQPSPRGHGINVKMEDEPYGEPLQRIPSQHHQPTLQQQPSHQPPLQTAQQQQPHQQQQPPPPHQHYQHHRQYSDHQHAPEPRRPSLSLAQPATSTPLGGASRSPGYWNSGGVPSAPPPPPPLPHQPPLSLRTSSGGSPPPLVGHGHHPSHSPPLLSMAPRNSVPPPPSQPVHSYHTSASSSSYSDWRRPTSAAPPPAPPPRREPLLHTASSSIPPLVTHNHLRPPPLGSMSHSSSGSMQNGTSGGYLGHSVLNGRPPSPRRVSGQPLPGSSASRDPYGHAYSAPPHISNGGIPNSSSSSRGSSSHHTFSQVLQPQRSSSSSFANMGLGASNVTREDFTTLGRDRGPSGIPPRPSEARSSSSASSNPSLRNLLS